MLRALVALNENLKNQESKFKANCKRQLASLKLQMEQMEKEMYFIYLDIYLFIL
jgi:hypothetical protein